jgi:hypothetical protein
MTVASRLVADVAFWALVANLRLDPNDQSDVNKLIPAEVGSLPR